MTNYKKTANPYLTLYQKIANSGYVDYNKKLRKNLVKQFGVAGLPPIEPAGLPGNPYVTSGTSTNPKLAAQEDVPNYAPSVSENVSCDKCRAYRKTGEYSGYCEKYDFVARADYSCDSWTSRHGALLRQKLRGL